MTVGFTLRNVIRKQVQNADPCPGRERLNPQPKIAGKDGEEHEPGDQQRDQHDQPDRAAAEQIETALRQEMAP